jgi:hypothetical protein
VAPDGLIGMNSTMEGVLLSAGMVAVLVGLGALVEAVRPRRVGPGRKPARPSGH